MELTSLSQVRENILFRDPVSTRYGKRIKIEADYGNDRRGPLVIKTPLLFSYGVSEWFSKGKLKDYYMPFKLSPSYNTNELYDCLRDIENCCNIELFKVYGDLEAMKILQEVFASGQIYNIAYPKLLYAKKTNKFSTLFNEDERKCFVSFVLIIDSIYISKSGRAKIQIKVDEVCVNSLL